MLTGSVLTLLLFAYQAGQPTTAARSIAGTIVDSISQRPLTKTRVTIAPTAARSSTRVFLTGADGHFRFEGLAPGKYSLSAERLGYPSQPFGARTLYARYSSAVVVGEGVETDNLLFPLIRGGIITGRVTEGIDEPVAGMTVTALHIVGIGKGRRVAHFFTQTTDDRGIYRIPYLPQGKFAVVVRGKPWQQEAHVSTRRTAYPLTYFPGSANPDEAALVEVKPGQESRADIAVSRVPAARLIGHLAGGPAAGNTVDKRYVFLTTPALFGYKVTLGPSHGVSANRVRVEDLAPGHYVINLVQEGNQRGAYQPVDVIAPETDVTVGESPAALVSATVTVDGHPRSPGGSMSVVLVSLDAEVSPSQALSAEGRAVFDAVPPGRYEASVAMGLSRGQGAVVGVKARGAAVSGTVVTIPETGKVELDITLDGSAIDLNGKVQCDTGACAGVLAMLVKRSGWELTGAYRFDQSDSDGSFSWKGVARGDYMMFAFENTDPLDYDDPAVIRQLLPGAQSVTVNGDPKQMVTLQLTGSGGKK